MKPTFLKLKHLLYLPLLISLAAFNSCSRSVTGSLNLVNDLSSEGSVALNIDKSFGSNGCRAAGNGVKFFNWQNGFYISGVNSISRHFSSGQPDTSWGTDGQATPSLLQPLLGTNESYELLAVDSQGRWMVGTQSRLCRFNSDFTLDETFQQSGSNHPGCVPATLQSAEYQFSQIAIDQSQNYWLVRINGNHIYVDGYGPQGDFLGTYDLGIQSPTTFGFSLRDVGVAQNQLHIIFNSHDSTNRELTAWITFDLSSTAVATRAADLLKRRIRIDSQGRWIQTTFNSANMTGSVEIEAANGTNEWPATSLGPLADDIIAAPLIDGGVVLMTGYRRPTGTSTGISLIRMDSLGLPIATYQAGSDLGLPSKCDDTAYCRAEFLDLNNQGGFSFVLASGSDEVSMLCRFRTP